MKKTLKLTITLAAALSFIITSIIITSAAGIADDDTGGGNIPLKKTQIDWLISGAGGDVAAAGGDPAECSGQFSYEFSSQDGSIKGIVQAVSGNIKIYALGSDGLYTECTGSEPAAVLANTFTQHFATLTRTEHFHDTHPLSERGTEEFPIALGSFRYMTFCYASLENGGMMSAMVFEGNTKFVYNLQKNTRNIPLSSGNNPDPSNPGGTDTPNNPNNPGGTNAPNTPGETNAPNHTNNTNNLQQADNSNSAGGAAAGTGSSGNSNTGNNNNRAGTNPLDTGVEGVIAFAGIAVLAIGAIIISSKAKQEQSPKNGICSLDGRILMSDKNRNKRG